MTSAQARQEYQSVWCEISSRRCKYTWLTHISYYTILPKCYKIPRNIALSRKKRPFLGFSKNQASFYSAYDNCQKLEISARITINIMTRTITIQNRQILFSDSGDGLGTSILFGNTVSTCFKIVSFNMPRCGHNHS